MLANLNSCYKLTCKPAITLMNIKMIWNAAATTRNKTSVSGSILKESYVNSIK
jgi:hypothetical protein